MTHSVHHVTKLVPKTSGSYSIMGTNYLRRNLFVFKLKFDEPYV